MSGTRGNELRSRVFARFYDRVLAPTEEAGLGEMRRDLLSRAGGRTLEIGAGTGVNLDHYPEGIDSLVLTEPDRHMAAKLRARLASKPRDAFFEVVQVPAESLPFPDASFDTVVCTLVLCTVPDPEATLAEVSRVLKPGGRLLFIEHVLGDGGTARWQRALARPWAAVACGCRCDRTTAETIAASPLVLEVVQAGRMPKAAKIIKPMIHGCAVRPAA
ncbi:MAG: class I SAM-dependent methyltransferase [Actinomycetes bacterium]